MTLLLTLAFLAVLLISLASVYLLGFRLGGQHWLGELQRVREESFVAQHRLHSLTRQAFVAMAEEADGRRTGRT